jgi:hypothetical protein
MQHTHGTIWRLFSTFKIILVLGENGINTDNLDTVDLNLQFECRLEERAHLAPSFLTRQSAFIHDIVRWVSAVRSDGIDVEFSNGCTWTEVSQPNDVFHFQRSTGQLQNDQSSIVPTLLRLLERKQESTEQVIVIILTRDEADSNMTELFNVLKAYSERSWWVSMVKFGTPVSQMDRWHLLLPGFMVCYDYPHFKTQQLQLRRVCTIHNWIILILLEPFVSYTRGLISPPVSRRESTRMLFLSQEQRDLDDMELCCAGCQIM